jgi:serine phosphatase RsbU (regulator of sigma subunit)/ligand-binding sensor domain-containing protein
MQTMLKMGLSCCNSKFYFLVFLLFTLLSCNEKEAKLANLSDSISFKKIIPIVTSILPDTIKKIAFQDLNGKNITGITSKVITSSSGKGKFIFQEKLNLTKITKEYVFNNYLNNSDSIKFASVIGLIKPIQNKPTHFGEQFLLTKIAAEQNLPGSTVNCFLQDKHQRLWIGTDGGLAIYNGLNFEIFNTESGIAHNYISCLEQGNGDTIYIGTKGGVNIFIANKMATLNPSNCKALPSKEIECIKYFNNFLMIGTLKGLTIINGNNYCLLNKQSKFDGEQIKDIEFIENNKLAVATIDAGLIHLDLTSAIKSTTITSALSINTIKKIGNEIYIGTSNQGLLKLKQDSLFAYVSENSSYSKLNIFDLCKSKNDIAIATFGYGILLLNHTELISVNQFEKELTQYANCLITNQSDDLLIGGAGGLFKMSNKFNYIKESAGLATSIPTAVSFDLHHKLWVSTINGGLSIFNDNKVEYINTKNGLSGNNIMQIFHAKSGKTYLANSGNGLDILFKNKVYNLGKKIGLEMINVNCVVEDNAENIWIGTNENGLYKWDGKYIVNYGQKQGIKSNSIYGLSIDDKNNLLIGTNGDGLLMLSNENKLVAFNKLNGIENEVIYCSKQTHQGIFFGSYGGGLYWLKNNNELANISVKDGLCDQSVLSLTIDDKNNLYCATAKGISIIDYTSHALKISNYSTNEGFINDDFNANAIALYKDKLVLGCHDYLIKADLSEFKTGSNEIPFLTDVELGEHSIKTLQNIVDTNAFLLNSVHHEILSIKYSDNKAKFVLGYGNNWFNKHELNIKFKLDGLDKNWINASIAAKTDGYIYNNLAPGNYVYKYTVQQTNNLWSKPYQFSFSILPPWYRTIYAYLSYSLLFIGSLFGFASYRNRILIEKNQQLENIVIERTKEIVEQKEEIEKSKTIVELQNHELEEKNHEIIQSITYAKRLQEAILPQHSFIDKFLSDYFILYMPKDIVAGDFYWFEPYEINNQKLLFYAAADCTGHGVPGAMVSVVCSSALNRSLLEFNITDTGQILDKVREIVIETFQKSKEEVKDGMDISLCCLNLATRELLWSGANNPLWVIRNKTKSLESFKPDKQPIGKSENPTPFYTNHILLEEGDCIYIFTDGYQDQFGGEKGKKFMAAKMKEMFINNYENSMSEQKEIAFNAIQNWKGQLEQVDDICVWGVKI